MRHDPESIAAARDAGRDPGSGTPSAAEGKSRALPPVLSKAPPVAMVNSRCWVLPLPLTCPVIGTL